MILEQSLDHLCLISPIELENKINHSINQRTEKQEYCMCEKFCMCGCETRQRIGKIGSIPTLYIAEVGNEFPISQINASVCDILCTEVEKSDTTSISFICFQACYQVIRISNKSQTGQVVA